MNTEQTKAEIAIEARAHVRRIEALVEAAEAAWKAAFDAAQVAPPPYEYPSDPEVEWEAPKNEDEAARDLNVSRLGGELYAARIVLRRAKEHAASCTAEAMKEAAYQGRAAWKERHGF